MKFTLSILIILLIFKTTNGATYYISNIWGNDSYTETQAQSSLTPWKTIDRLNLFNKVMPGDSILFNRGESFLGSLKINVSGTQTKEIFYGPYGKGANPIISGFKTISAWNLLRNSIYYASLDLPNLNIVTLNDIVQKMGRYPNSGYLKYESHIENKSITDNELSGSPSWIGGEVVIRKSRWIIDRQVITFQKGGTLNYNALAKYGNNNAYKPVNGNGYFIQNHLSTLDQFGEWYYDAVAKKLFIHFGDKKPEDIVVKVSVQDKNCEISTRKYITISNITFEGGNTKGISLISSQYISLDNCNFNNQGGVSIYGGSLNYIKVNGGSVNNSLSNGIQFEYDANYCTLNGVTVKNTNLISGSGRSGDGVGNGISISGNYTTIINNEVKNSGYNGIHFMGNDVVVEHNFIDSFCITKDDGGGIYTYSGNSSILNRNRQIKNNIILNAIGAFAGVESYYYEPFGKAAGIYLDDFTNNTVLSNNTVANGDWSGIFLHNTHSNSLLNNLVYNYASQLEINQYTAITRNTTIIGNKFIARKASQKVMFYKTYVSDNPALIGLLDSNFYARPIADSATFVVDKDYPGGGGAVVMTLAKWKVASFSDVNSHKSPKAITNINELMFEYNATSFSKTVSLDANYIDVSREIYNGNITLPRFTSAVLIRSSQLNVLPIASAGANQTIILPANNVSLFGSATNDGTITSYTWRKIGGPSNGIIANPNAVATSVIGLEKGIYSFELTVNYKGGVTVKDSMTVNVVSSDKTLPVTTISFAGEVAGNINSLSWATSAEENNAGFEVEQSNDGTNFKKIKFQPTKAINGYSRTTISYALLDTSVEMETNFYRLRQINKDGRSTYSGIVKLNNRKRLLPVSISLYPNPVSNTINLKLKLSPTDKISISVIDISGRTLLRKQINKIVGDGMHQVNASSLPAGTYFLEILSSSTGRIALKKFEKQ
ncbi:PKD domain-containing protein [Segetibacter aerophilus]|uniref:Secretion system C-terminal sorting domain-containing protein n=1 Tax=Segetibacter aerophilus TaxID=670293 RepID=A0A512BH13_9BACT|nr:T9SS type A sorting domain-containing protein [Segetibacter aerophilus]GEO11249.1 hypothetical protein SAE01_37450 [Segetibacter aerophilus]